MARPKSELGDIRTSPRSVRILRWLRREPVPAKVVGETADGDEVTVTVTGSTPTKLRDVIGAVRDCVELQAFGKDDNLLRRLPLHDEPGEPKPKAEHGGATVLSIDVPKLVDAIARNIREASSEAARSTAQAHGAGFTAMTNVVNLALQLLGRLDARLREAEEEARTITTTGEEDEPDTRQALMLQALQQAMGGNKANGAGFDPAKLASFLQQVVAQQQPQQGDHGES